MESLKKLKEELQFNIELTELLDILKGIAVAQYWSLENKKDRFETFLKAFEEFFDIFDFNFVDHPMAKGGGNLGLIVITTNEGFMGGLNNRIIDTALMNEGAQSAELIVVGDRGAAYLKAMGRSCKEFPGIDPDFFYELAVDLKNYIIEQSLSGKIGRLKLFYPQSISFMVHKIQEVTLLPCHELFEKAGQGKEPPSEVIVESAMGDLIEYLVESWILQQLFHILEDSKLAEYSARTIHLEESYQVSLEQHKGIKNRYFRNNREIIDRGLRDMFSAQIIKKKEKV